MTSFNIVDQYAPFYKGQEGYYHDFNHAKFTVKKGIEILESMGISKYLILIHCHAMGLHDAGHLNMPQESDMDNIQIALKIFSDNWKKDKNTNDFKMIKAIILSTAAPYERYESVDKIIKNSGVEEVHHNDLRTLIFVARDCDRLGIIGQEEQSLREMALVGFIKELLRKETKESLLRNLEGYTNAFFDKVVFDTEYGKKWATDNLENRRLEQLKFGPQAIKLASI